MAEVLERRFLRYFEEKTQAQIAEKFGISQVQVSRLEKKILASLRNYWKKYSKNKIKKDEK